MIAALQKPSVSVYLSTDLFYLCIWIFLQVTCIISYFDIDV